MTSNEISELATRVMRTSETIACIVTDPAEQSRLEDAYHLAQGVLEMIGPSSEGVPTTEQALALGAWMRQQFTNAEPAMRRVNVSQGGAGLPDTYLYVTWADGYVGGIDLTGRVST